MNGMFNRNVQKITIIGVRCGVNKKRNIASLFAIITCMKTPLLTDAKKMDVNDTNNKKNCKTEAGPPLSPHNNGHPSNTGCSGLSDVRRGGHGHWRRESRREESNILNTNICATLYAYRHPSNLYYSNNYNVSFNSSPGTSETQNFHQIAKYQQETLNKYRKWVNVSGDLATNGTYFTVLNYNVLAQDLVQENAYLYRNHSARACLWETRWNNLYREITSYNADIICLQEVQQSHLNNYYKQFENLGYVGIYKKRTGLRPDGCAIYYKKSLFKILGNTTVEFNQRTNALDRENIAIIARFAPVQRPNAEFVVATTHLLYNPKRMDVRVAQTQVLLAEIERMAYKNLDTGYVPIIITGDFNSKPDSAVYKLIVEGRLKYENLSNRTLTPIVNQTNTPVNGKLLVSPRLKITDNCQHFELVKARESGAILSPSSQLSLVNLRHTKRTHDIDETFTGDARLFATGTLTHNFRFMSAFKHVANGDCPEATTHQNEWITVDYIFYSGKLNTTSRQTVENKLILTSNYRIPTTSELQEIKHIPNFVVGSDHLPLLSKFKLID